MLQARIAGRSQSLKFHGKVQAAGAVRTAPAPSYPMKSKRYLDLSHVAAAMFVVLAPSLAQAQVCRGQAELTSNRPVQVGGAFQRSGRPTPSHAKALDLALGVSHIWGNGELISTRHLDLNFSTIDLNLAAGVSLGLPGVLRNGRLCPSVTYHVGKSVDPDGFFSNHVQFISEGWLGSLDAGIQMGHFASMRLLPFGGVSRFRVTVSQNLSDGEIPLVRRVGTAGFEWHAGARLLTTVGLTFGVSTAKAFAQSDAGTPIRFDVMYSVPPFWRR